MQPHGIDKLALYYEAEGYSTAGKRLMGRQSAGAGFLKALVAARPERLWCYVRSRESAARFSRDIRDYGGAGIETELVPFLQPAKLAEAGLLYRPDPMIALDAWRRLAHASPRAYSLCGVTHTTASQPVMEAVAGLLTAPLEEWDAIVCTSRAVRDSLRTIIENAAGYLRERVGASRLTLPQLPVIPLGVHCDDFVSTDHERAAARRELGIGPDETVALFVGRLSFAGKAHPLPMYLGLEACAREAPVTLIQAGWFGNEAIERTFKEEAQQLCPTVRCLFVEGRDAARRRQAWAAADIFTSLSDNIQETFGLTPIEAMAAGLPVVVSDWDGYRDTVRDGVDGFRVPTLTMPPGTGADFADRHDLNIDNYDYYCGTTAQFVAVDAEGIAEAYRKLVRDPALRKRMGEAGRQRARQDFDWSVVMEGYVELWRDLNERRRSSPDLHPRLTKRRRPDRADPFSMFASYPTHRLDSRISFRRIAGVDPTAAVSRRELASIRFAADFLPSAELIGRLLEIIPGSDWIAAEDILARFPAASRTRIGRALVWLAKVGVLKFRSA